MILLPADALENLRSGNVTPAPTHFRDSPSDVCQLQKIGLPPLDSLSPRHSKGISSLLPPLPALLTHFVALKCLRIFLGFFMLKEKVIMDSGTCSRLSVSMTVEGNFFFFSKKKKALTYQRQIFVSCLFF